MIKSMTGYGKSEAQLRHGTLTIEIIKTISINITIICFYFL